jgi:CIC family chloride channel protein
VLRRAKSISTAVHPAVRVAGAGVVLAALFVLSKRIFGEGLTLGPGYRTVQWATDPRHSGGAVLVLLLLRAIATTTTLAGGGVGGLFIPLVIEGALLGRAAASAFGRASASLFPVVGIAAFLGAGYRTPLAGVMFVAESTGRPGFVVPGLLAAVVAQLAMGRSSVSPYQRSARAGHLERRFSLPLTTAIVSDVLTAPPDTTLEELVHNHLLTTRQKSVPVVDGGRYVGLVRSAELAAVPREQWPRTRVEELVSDDVPTGRPEWRLRDAIAAMESADVDVLPVTDEENRFVGVVSTSEILKLDEILGEAEGT